MEDNNWYAVDVTFNDPIIEGCSSATSGYEHENYLLIGKHIKINNIAFGESHRVANILSDELNTTAFINGPQLSSYRYWPN